MATPWVICFEVCFTESFPSSPKVNQLSFAEQPRHSVKGKVLITQLRDEADQQLKTCWVSEFPVFCNE